MQLGHEGYAVLQLWGVQSPDRILTSPLKFGSDIRRFLGDPHPTQTEARTRAFRQYIHMVAWTNALESYQRVPLLVMFAVTEMMGLEKPE